MVKSDVKLIGDIAREKAFLANNNTGKFVLRGIMAGFYLVVAIILSNTVAALMGNISVELSKISSAMTFSIALALICFLGGELFTGSNLVMGIGVYSKSVSVLDLVKVFGLTYIGNFIGNFFISYIFVKSGSNTNLIREYIAPLIEGKLALSPSEMVLRGILCNFIVCICVMANIKMKQEGAKMTVMFWCIFAFVIAGFEHSIANMGIFSIGYFLLGELPLYGVLSSMFWVTIGNIIGGTVLYAYPLYKMAID
ncbi:MAG: formate/nitrite transporter family protein [Clostridium sp.]